MNGTRRTDARRGRVRGLIVLAALACSPPLAAGIRILDSPSVTLARPARVTTLAEQADGKLLVAGNFDRVNGEKTSRLVRLNPDGSRDTTFDIRYTGFPNFDVVVVAADGTLYVGGNFFIDIQGQTRRSLMKLAPDGTLDANWNPDPNSAVRSLLLDGNVLYVGGAFSTIGGQNRNRIARVDALGSGGADPAWDPNASGFVNDMLRIGGALIVSGSFTTIGGQTRQRIAKLDAASGTVDAVWNPGSANADPRALADPGGGGVLVGGVFTTLGGAPRANLARLALAGTGAADPAWTTGTDGAVNFILVEPAAPGAPRDPGDAGDVTIGGAFSTVGASARMRLARLRGNGDVVDNYGPAIQVSRHALPLINEAVIGLQDRDQFRAVVAGQFDSIDGAAAFAIGRIGTGGLHDPSFAASIQVAPLITQVALDPQTGDVYVGGQFSVVDQQYPLKNLLRLARAADLPNGDPQFVLDPTWAFNTGDSLFASVVTSLQLVGRSLFVGGRFASLGGIPRTNLGAIDLDTGTVSGWQVAVTGTVAEAQVMALAADGPATLYAAGYFETIGGEPIRYVARLGTAVPALVDSTFAPNPNQVVGSLLPLSSGALLFGGVFSQVAGVPRPWLARWPVSAEEPQLDIDLNGPIDRMILQFTSATPEETDSVFMAGRLTFVDGSPVGGAFIWESGGDGSVVERTAPTADGVPFGLASFADCVAFSRYSGLSESSALTTGLTYNQITTPEFPTGAEHDADPFGPLDLNPDYEDPKFLLLTLGSRYSGSQSAPGRSGSGAALASDLSVLEFAPAIAFRDDFEDVPWPGPGCDYRD